MLGEPSQKIGHRGTQKGAVFMDKYIRGEAAVHAYGTEGGVVDKEAVLRRTGYFKDNEPISLETSGGAKRSKDFSPYARDGRGGSCGRSIKMLSCGCGLCAFICAEFTIHVDSLFCRS